MNSICRIARRLALLALAPALMTCGGDSLVLPGDTNSAVLTVLGGNDQLGMVGTPLPDSLVVRLTDPQARPIAGQQIAFALGAGGAGGQVNPDLATTDAQGRVTARWVLGRVAGSQEVEARVDGVGSSQVKTIFTAQARPGAADTVYAVAGQNQSGAVGATLADSLVVLVTDHFGNPVSGVDVAWSVTGGGSINPSSGTTGNDGRAAAQRILGKSAGPETTLATVNRLGGSPVQFAHTATPGGPTALVLVSGDRQTAPAGFQLADSLVVRVVDGNDNGISGRSVTWVVATGGGSVSPVTSTTDVNGFAVSRWKLGSRAGPNTLNAVVSGLGFVTFSATGIAASPSQMQLNGGNNQTAAAGDTLRSPLSVRITDANGNPVAGVAVTWTITGGGGSLSASSTGTDGNGVAQVLRILGPAPGTQTTGASVSGLSGSPVSFTSTATAGAAANLAITTQPAASAQSGVPFGRQPVLRLEDRNGNPVALAGVPVTAAITAGPGGVLSGTRTVTTDPGGSARFADLAITGLPGSYLLRFSATGLTGVTSAAISLGAGGPAALAVATQPSSSVANGQAFPQQPVIQVTDASGNPVSQAGVSVSAAIASGAGTLNGTLAVTTNGNGVARFTDLSISGAAGPRTLEFRATGLASVTSTPVTVGAGGAAQIAANAGNNQTASAGSPVPIDPSVLVTDGAGNPVAGVSVSFAVASGGGSVTGASQTTNSSGIATVGEWTLGPAVGANTMTATAPGLSGSPVTFTATAVAGAAGRIAITQQPSSSARSGTAFGQQPVVRLEDPNGNPVQTSGVAITASASGGTLGGTVTVSTSNGVAAFTNLSLSGTMGNYTLTFSGSGLSGATSNAISLGAGSAQRLSLTTQPSSTAQSGSAFARQPVVQVQDAAGNEVAQSGISVTAAIASGGGTLGGGTTISTDGTGAARFTNLAITGSPGPRTLLFAAPQLTSDTSSTVTLTSGAATTVALNAGNNQTATVGTLVATDPSVIVTDGGGNPVAGVAVVFAVASGGGSVTGASQTTDAGGIATVGGWTLGPSPGSNTLTATAAGVSGSPVTFTATGTTGAPAGITKVSGDNQTGTAGSLLANPLVVEVDDAQGNPVNGVTVTWSIVSGGGSITASSTTGSNGQASADWTLGATTGKQTARASAAGQAVDFDADAQAPAPSRISLNAGNGQRATVGTTVATDPSVLVTDSQGGPVSGVTVLFAVASGGGSVSGPNPATDANGLAAVGSWTLGTTAGVNTLTATSAGLSGSPVTFTATGDPGPVNAAASTADVPDGKVQVSTTITIFARDAFGNLVGIGGANVVVDVSGSNSAGPTTATDNADGTYTAQYIPMVAGTDSVSITLNGSPVSGSPYASDVQP